MDKVDRALEVQVIDWLQWSEFPENIGKRPDDSDMAQLALKLISKRKQAYTHLKAENEKLVQAIGEHVAVRAKYWNQIEKLKAALEFYADPNRWLDREMCTGAEYANWFPNDNETVFHIYEGSEFETEVGGKRARATLAEIGGDENE